MTKKPYLAESQKGCFGTYEPYPCDPTDRFPGCNVRYQCKAASRSTGARAHARTRVRGGV